MIAAVVLAAGQSRRMGRPKINLPWRDSTVLGAIIRTLTRAGISDIVVVTGEVPVQGLTDDLNSKFRLTNNPHFQHSEMLVSLQIGLRLMFSNTQAALVVLGDQPQIETKVVRKLLKDFADKPCPILVPSYQMRRGHPWILERSLWPEVLSLPPDVTLRYFLNCQSDKITYVSVDTESILQDLDTPEDYEKYQPR